MPSFHYYPSAKQIVDAPPNPYSRAIPVACDTKEFDTLGSYGHFDIVNHCYVADVSQIILFHAQALFITPMHNGVINAWFYKNVLPPPDGSATGEVCGDDCPVYNPNNNRQMTARTTRRMMLAAGDRVWFVAGCPGGGTVSGGPQASGASGAIDSYFEGNILEFL